MIVFNFTYETGGVFWAGEKGALRPLSRLKIPAAGGMGQSLLFLKEPDFLSPSTKSLFTNDLT